MRRGDAVPTARTIRWSWTRWKAEIWRKLAGPGSGAHCPPVRARVEFLPIIGRGSAYPAAGRIRGARREGGAAEGHARHVDPADAHAAADARLRDRPAHRAAVGRGISRRAGL